MAGLLVCAGALLVLGSASPALRAQSAEPGVPRVAAEPSRQLETDRGGLHRLRSLLGLLTVTLLLLLAFVVGAYVMVRIGRAFVRRPRRRKPTRYVDAWAGYRLSEQEIQRAVNEASTMEPEPDSGPDDDTDDEPDRNNSE